MPGLRPMRLLRRTKKDIFQYIIDQGRISSIEDMGKGERGGFRGVEGARCRHWD